MGDRLQVAGPMVPLKFDVGVGEMCVVGCVCAGGDGEQAASKMMNAEQHMSQKRVIELLLSR